MAAGDTASTSHVDASKWPFWVKCLANAAIVTLGIILLFLTAQGLFGKVSPGHTAESPKVPATWKGLGLQQRGLSPGLNYASIPGFAAQPSLTTLPALQALPSLSAMPSLPSLPALPPPYLGGIFSALTAKTASQHFLQRLGASPCPECCASCG